ncbi:MAG: hypothetical protein NT031_03375 [Planctomycetota bacterium]|nr:hypothetical protein [Planctomycetota bacterium]
MHKKITIGKSASCNLRLPFPWLHDEHLVIENSNDLVRIRSVAGGECAMMDGRELASDWAILPPSSRVAIPGGPHAHSLLLDFDYKPPKHNAVILQGDASSTTEPACDSPAQLVTASPLDQRGWLDWAQADPQPSDTSIAPTASTPVSSCGGKPQGSPKARILVGTALCMFVTIVGLLLYNRHCRRLETEQVKAEMKYVRDHLCQAETLLSKKEYAAAKAALEAAAPLAKRHGDLAYESEMIATLQQSEAIRLGGAGYVRDEGRWLPAETARALAAARERDDPKIASREREAADALKAGKCDDARLACEEALALMASFPVKPHPKEKAITDLLEAAKAQAQAAEMTAKGYVLYQNKWVTPDQKFRLEQQARGLEEYRNKWMTKDEAFAAKQTDKGLVLFGGQWMTPDDKMIAQGYAQFEGQWVKAEEKARIIAKREADAQLEQARLAAEQARQDEERERARQEAARAEKLKAAAYSMSQEFIKKKLKAPASAIFQPYASDDVTVLYKDGWFLVKAPVDSQNSYGAMLRGTYISKLRPIPGSASMWEAEATFMVD